MLCKQVRQYVNGHDRRLIENALLVQIIDFVL